MEAWRDPLCRKLLPHTVRPQDVGKEYPDVNPRSRSSAAKTISLFPNWIEQVETALAGHLKGLSRKAIKEEIAELEGTTTGVSGSVDTWLRAFETERTEAGKRDAMLRITANVRAYLKNKGEAL